ncbi:vesicular glutamate transporter 3-like [Arctopsyche grandis]|uniref:vesicular glutamate transporter 3-like n=1 Tax=Arctopsyche grandis TaxID=121162 RepID=UPI00406D7069
MTEKVSDREGSNDNIGDEQIEVPGYGKRHIQAVLLFILIAVSTAIGSSMTITILAMTEATSPYDHTIYNWDKQIHGFIMSSSFWGDVIVQGIAGHIANKYGSKNVLTVCIFITGLLMMSTPWFAELAGWKGVCLCMSLQGSCQGFITPCLHMLIGRWAPVNERTRFAMFIYSGMYGALIITPPIAAYICNSFLGWPWSYYIFGSQSFVGGLLWIYFGVSSPSHHKTISIKERTFIEKDLDQTNEVWRIK